MNITTVAYTIARQAGASLVITPGVAYDITDTALATLAGALQERIAAVGADLISLDRHGARLTACVDDRGADEPLCPNAFHRVVRRLSYELLCEAWDGVLTTAEPTPTQPGATARVA